MNKTQRAALALLVPLILLAQGVEPAWVREHWVTTHNGASKRNRFTDIYLDAADNVYACGQGQWKYNNGWEYGMELVKYNQWGDSAWDRGSRGADIYSQRHIAHALATDHDTVFYIVGALDKNQYGSAGLDMAWAKYDSAGNRLWLDSIEWNLDAVLYDVCVAGDGNVYACGAKQDTVGGVMRDFYVVMRIDAMTGDTVWTRSYELDPVDQRPEGLKTRLERRARDRLPDFYEDWDDWYNCACAIAPTPDNRVVVTGYGYDSGDEYQMWTMKFQANGNRQWARADGRTAMDYDDAAFDVAVATTGYIYICGFDNDNTPDNFWDFAVYRYAATGGTPQMYSLNGTDDDDDIAWSICLDTAALQNVYVTGVVDFDKIVTQKLTGGLVAQWGGGGAVYGDPGDWAYGYDIAYSPGRVYVTGDSAECLVALGYTEADSTPKVPVWTYHYVSADTMGDVGSAIWASDTDHVMVTGASERDPLLPSGCHSAPVIRLFYPDRDVRADTMLAPADTIPFGTAVAPRYWVVNEGNDRGQLVSYFSAGDGFADTVIGLNYIYPGETLEVTHNNWSPSTWGNIAVRCSVAMVGDNDHGNDAITDTVFVARHDVGFAVVAAPGSVVDSGQVVVPQAQVYNWGNISETFDCWMAIDPGYRETTFSVTVGPAANQLVAFPDWVPEDRDTWAVRCSTMLTGDMASYNDSAMAKTFVRVTDVMAKNIWTPSGPYDPYDSINPVAEWQNNGNLPANFEAWMILEDPALDARVYQHKIDVYGLRAGDDTTLTQFPGITLENFGYWTCRCSTGMAGDLVAANDYIDRGFLVGGDPDIGIAAIVAPSGVVDTATTVTPRVMLHNYGNVSIPFQVRLHIYDPAPAEVYFDSVNVPGLSVGADSVASLPVWLTGSDTGDFLAICSLVVSDLNAGNDTLTRAFRVSGLLTWPAGWQEVMPVPPGQSGSPVKRGGALAVMPGDPSLIYATKGYKTSEYYSYNWEGDEWTSRADVPLGPEGKPPRKGAKLCSDGERYIYLVKGNNTLAFWRYDTQRDSWAQMPDVPIGPDRKKVKGGGDMEFIVKDDTGRVYLMKGYRTEFYCYNPAAARWDTLDRLPYGYKEKYDKGSWLCWDGERYLYIHQAKYYNRATQNHYMFRYEPLSDSWPDGDVTGMPLWGLHSGRVRKKKAKDGSSAAWSDGLMYSLKGGNTQQFFRYTPASDSWTEIDTMPTYSPTTGRKRRVKYGSDMVAMVNALWALKGNKTREFWRYGFGTGEELFATGPARSGVAGGATGRPGFGFAVSPNPLTGDGALRYAVPRPTRLTAGLYDPAGRLVRSMARGRQVSATGLLRLDTRGLPRGVYLLRVETDLTAPRALKVVIE